MLVDIYKSGLFVATSPAFIPALADDHASQVTELAMPPIFAAPLHDETELDAADGAASPPMFIQSFESAEETLPFELTIAEPYSDDSVSQQVVVALPVLGAEAPSAEFTEEIREELVQLEVKAVLKWAKSQ